MAESPAFGFDVPVCDWPSTALRLLLVGTTNGARAFR